MLTLDKDLQDSSVVLELSEVFLFHRQLLRPTYCSIVFKIVAVQQIDLLLRVADKLNLFDLKTKLRLGQTFERPNCY